MRHSAVGRCVSHALPTCHCDLVICDLCSTVLSVDVETHWNDGIADFVETHYAKHGRTQLRIHVPPTEDTVG